MGAVGSKIGGGSYENGAMTAAFGYLFNEVAGGVRRCGANAECLWRDAQEKMMNVVMKALTPPIPDAANIDVGMFMVSGGVTASRDGDLFLNFAINRPYPVPTFKAGVGGGFQFIDGGQSMDRDTRAGIIGGAQTSVSGCLVFCIGRAYSPTDYGKFVGTTSIGLGGAAFTYSPISYS